MRPSIWGATFSSLNIKLRFISLASGYHVVLIRGISVFAVKTTMHCLYHHKIDINQLDQGIKPRVLAHRSKLHYWFHSNPPVDD